MSRRRLIVVAGAGVVAGAVVLGVGQLLHVAAVAMVWAGVRAAVWTLANHWRHLGSR